MKAVKVQVSAMAHGGSALARHEGKVIFVPYVLPGEDVLVEVTEEKARYSRGRPVEIITPSADRIEPRCPHFGTCGGCQWQHIAYERQLSIREEVLRSQLKRIAHLSDAPVEPTLATEGAWHYRNHVQLHLDEEGRLGFMAAEEHAVVPLDECHIMHPLLWDVFSALDVDFPELERVSLRAGISTGERLLVLELAGKEPPVVEVDLPISCVLLLKDGTPVTYVGNNYVTESIGGRALRISAGSFFQVHTSQAEELLAIVKRYADPQEDDIVLDLYCGVGTFALNLSDNVAQIVGIDSSESAIDDARYNSQDITNVRFEQGSAEDLLPSIEQPIDLVILDPPRQGLSKEALTALMALGPPKVVYVSCDPATLARDVAQMLQVGYELLEVQPVDMFPQTYHVEAVALLERR
jgi:23S rRNA (uracil1939-C5)-methyltransferase